MSNWIRLVPFGDSTGVAVPLVVALSVVFVLLVLAVLLWSVKRRPRLHYSITGEGTDLLDSIAGLTHTQWLDGNAIEIVENGRFFPMLIETIGGARKTVHFETYLWKTGEASGTVVDALCAKAREGIHVRVLIDALGGKRIRRKERRALTDAGCHLELYHPFRISNLGRLNNRDHRKACIIDGEVAILGGHCITDDWLGDAEDRSHFRDVSVRVRGPVVAQIQSAFSENWIEESGEIFVGTEGFPKLEPVGEMRAATVYVTSSGSSSSVETLHYMAVHSAKKSLYIQNPYFLPDPDGIDALGAAVERGVDVRVMIPSASATDNALVQHASHHKYGALLEAGVHLFEYGKTLLHQKLFVVDSEWCAIGSSNFDDRSFELNDELMLMIHDVGVTRQLAGIFETDMQHAEQWSRERWKKRPILHKLTDGFAFLLNEQL